MQQDFKSQWGFSREKVEKFVPDILKLFLAVGFVCSGFVSFF